MKNFILLLTTLLSIVLFTSCDKEPEINADFELRKSYLVGDWIGGTQFTGGFDNSLSLTLNEDGTGIKYIGPTNEGLEWSYQSDPEQIVIEVQTTNLNYTRTFLITTNTETTQTWTEEVPGLDGSSTTFTRVWELTRP